MIIFLTILLGISCSGEANNASPNNAKANSQPANTAKTGPLPIYGYEVVKSYPHDPQAFTQGLFFHDGFLYESTGQEGKSSIRKVEIDTGKKRWLASLFGTPSAAEASK